MNFRFLTAAVAVTFAAGMVAGCAGAKLQRVPPGQSIRRHLENQQNAANEPVPIPGTDMPQPAGAPGEVPGTANPAFAGQPLPGTVVPPEQLPPLPVVGLPERSDALEKAMDAYQRGVALAKGGQDADAIAAFEEATLVDPSFADAWTQLTILYERTGQAAKAKEAFRRVKNLNARPERLTTPAVPSPGVLPSPQLAPPAPTVQN